MKVFLSNWDGLRILFFSQYFLNLIVFSNQTDIAYGVHTQSQLTFLMFITAELS